MEEGLLVELTDDEGASYSFEVVGNIEFENESYVVFLPTDIDEDDPSYGFVILRSVDVGGIEDFESVDDEELLEKLYALYMEAVFEEDEGADEPE